MVGIALGNSWISPEDFVVSWGPILRDLSRLDNSGLEKCNSAVQKIKQQLSDAQFAEATSSWIALELTIQTISNQVDAGLNTESSSTLAFGMRRYSTYMNSLGLTEGQKKGDIGSFLNGVIKEKLKLPSHVIWGNQSDEVFYSQWGDFMKPRINEVDQLLAKGVNVAIYNGQVDLICATKGVQAWIEKLKWADLKTFLAKDRTPLYCSGQIGTKGFTKSYNNLHFYWILKAGHFVPVDQPCVALNMIGAITNSPAFKPA